MTVLHHPIRVELQDGATVAFNQGPVSEVDLTLPHDVDRLNFGLWSGGNAGVGGKTGLGCPVGKECEGTKRQQSDFFRAQRRTSIDSSQPAHDGHNKRRNRPKRLPLLHPP
ncbi:MAG: hypothetical protein R3B95_16895 [Nitrospirales bacterium]|nr:hypothetical protein [Nitrospirales bacterium]